MGVIRKLNTEFVKSVPEELTAGTLYVSMEYASVVHLCCCGCGSEIVTPLSPKDWKLTYNGEGISLSPSIGNWSFPCRSHYWIRFNRVEWAGDMTDDKIREGRQMDRLSRSHGADPKEDPQGGADQYKSPKRSLWRRIFGIFD